MSRLLDSLICVAITLGMFACPMLLVGFAPYVGDTLMTLLDIRVGKSMLSHLGIVLLMLSSAAILLAVAAPLFAAILWPLSRLSRYGSHLIELAEPALRVSHANAGVTGGSGHGAGPIRPTEGAGVRKLGAGRGSLSTRPRSVSAGAVRAAVRERDRAIDA